ncbi:MAG: hypothetical protein JWP52_593, partial [Rhizobacter sp.]|nr:hypothetical protein [Rhizobacter sp.]
SLTRGSLRVLGTAAGAASAWLLASHVTLTPPLLSAALVLVGVATLYLALVSRHSYAWLFTGLTFSMVLLDGMEHPAEALDVFARSRFVEVFTGTFAAVLVSAVTTATVRRRLLHDVAETSAQAVARKRAPWHRAAFAHAAQGAIALGLIPWVWAWFGMEALSQSSTTIMAVLMVPLASLSTPVNTTRMKLVHRFVGCCLGGLLATGALLVTHDRPLAMTLAVCIGVVVGRHLENGSLGIGYVGTQFALAFLVVLVPDTYFSVNTQVGLDRLFGVVFGMVLLEPVRLVFQLVMSRWTRSREG